VVASPVDNEPAANGDVVVGRTRSPNYPSYKIDGALEKAELLYKAFKKFPVPIENASKTMGFASAASSTAAQAVATLKAYGFIDVQGSGAKRTVAVTDAAVRIIARHPDRAKLLKEAALAPRIHKELYDQFVKPDGIAPDATIKTYLQFDRPGGTFNELAIDPLLREFRGTLAFAGLDSSGNLSPVAPDIPHDVAEGDLVQWESQGIAQFNEPKRVLELSDDGEWVFVEGSLTGIPLNEVKVIQRAAGKADTMSQAPSGINEGIAGWVPARTPPPAPPPKPQAGQKVFNIYLADGQQAVLYVPANITDRDFELLEMQIRNNMLIIAHTASPPLKREWNWKMEPAVPSEKK
jgi:hypothetical protein